MSVSVPLDELAARIAERDGAFVVTVGAGGAPHVTSVAPRWHGDALEAGAGRTTRANAADRPSVTLLWPGVAPEPYSLLVDGTATVHEECLRVIPTRAVLHRSVEAPGDGPSCVRIESGGEPAVDPAG